MIYSLLEFTSFTRCAAAVGEEAKQITQVSCKDEHVTTVEKGTGYREYLLVVTSSSFRPVTPLHYKDD